MFLYFWVGAHQGTCLNHELDNSACSWLSWSSWGFVIRLFQQRMIEFGHEDTRAYSSIRKLIKGNIFDIITDIIFEDYVCQD